MTRFNPVDSPALDALAGIVGREHVFTSENDLAAYSSDETPGLSSMPQAAVRPKDALQVAEILKLAREKRFPVVPRGGGTGLSGGAVASLGGVVLSTVRLNHLFDIDEPGFAVVGSGYINGDLQREAEKLGMFYPVNPASMDSCTLGGNVATCAGGANSVRYGTTANYVTGLKAVMADGTVVKAGGRLKKNATDHHLVRMLLGSEGTLGIITEVTLKLLRNPAKSVVLIVPWNSPGAAVSAAMSILKKGFKPVMLEYMDKFTLWCTSSFNSVAMPFGEACCTLIIRLDDSNDDRLTEDYERIGELVLDMGAPDAAIITEKPRIREFWKGRSGIHEALAHNGLLADEDVVVPIDRVSELLKRVDSIADDVSLKWCAFGHLGDGNMHVNFIDSRSGGKAARQAAYSAVGRLFDLTVELGGKISGEHGIGVFKKPYLEKTVDPGFLSVMKNVKKAVDPSGILNPGKLFSIV